MPKLPGEKVLLHQATQILEDAVGYLSSHGDLMRFASEGTTRKMEVIIDPPIPTALPEGHAQYFRMEQERRNATQKIRENDAKRLELWSEATNDLFQTVRPSVQAAPLLSREMLALCDLSSDKIPEEARQPPGTFDGRLAWRMFLNHLFPEERTDGDKDYYRVAEQLQRDHPLPAGCAVAEYTKRATAFLHKIVPFQAAQHTPHDISDYLLKLMPKEYRESARRIAHDMKKNGTWLDHLEVIKEASKVVEEEQKVSVKVSALAALPAEIPVSDYASLLW